MGRDRQRNHLWAENEGHGFDGVPRETVRATLNQDWIDHWGVGRDWANPVWDPSKISGGILPVSWDTKTRCCAAIFPMRDFNPVAPLIQSSSAG